MGSRDRVNPERDFVTSEVQQACQMHSASDLCIDEAAIRWPAMFYRQALLSENTKTVK